MKKAYSYSIQLAAIITLIVGISSCQIGRFVVYNFANITDHKIFKERELTASTAPFQFEVTENAKHPKSHTNHENEKVDFDTFSSSLESIKNNEMDLKQILDSLGVKDSNMDLIDKSILYFALNEMVYGNLDKPVVIDESLRLSKKFSNPDSYKFINANLDKYLKSI